MSDVIFVSLPGQSFGLDPFGIDSDPLGYPGLSLDVPTQAEGYIAGRSGFPGLLRTIGF